MTRSLVLVPTLVLFLFSQTVRGANSNRHRQCERLAIRRGGYLRAGGPGWRRALHHHKG